MRGRNESQLPESVKDVLREFTIGYLLELCPVDVVDFGVQYFTRLQMDRAAQRTEPTRSKSVIQLDIETMAQQVIPKKTILEETAEHRTRTPRPSSTLVTTKREEIFAARIRYSLLFRDLDEDEIKAAIQLMSRVVMKSGDLVYETGDFDDKFYIIESGKLLVTAGDGLIRREMASNECIGELALLYNYARHTTVRVESDEAVLWTLSRKRFRQFMIDTARANLKMFERYLKTVPLFKKLSQSECRRVTQAMSVQRFYEGQRIFAEGDVRTGIFFIIDGKVTLKVREGCSGGHITLATLEEGDYIGELSLVTTSSHLVSAFAETDVKTIFLCNNAFNRLMGNAIELIKRQENEQ